MNEKEFEVQYRSGKIETMYEDKLPTFSEMFNMQVRELKVGEQMFEMTEGIIIKRIK